MKINKKLEIDKGKLFISETELKNKIKNIKVDLNNVKCEHCGKILKEDDFVYNKKILCPSCYNCEKEEYMNMIDFKEYCFHKLKIILKSSDFVKLKNVLLNKGYTYKEILFTTRYLNEIINKFNSNSSIGLVYYYIDKAIKYANENNIDLSIIFTKNYFEEYKNKHSTKSIKNSIRRYLKDKQEQYIIREYTKANHISEEQLEDYMINHLDLIEDNIKFIDRQRPIKNGIVDIAAKDLNNISCIIELKNNNKCERLERQCREYPEMFINNDIPFRMISLTSGYKGDKFNIIDNIGYVEMYQYDVIYGTLNNPIKELHIKRVN